MHGKLPSTDDNVTPLAGVWIEILINPLSNNSSVVTPLAGVWIEIFFNLKSEDDFGSLPLRECGLKSCVLYDFSLHTLVTPLAGVWIEILLGT